MPGEKMHFTTYLNAINAADMRKRANVIMCAIWPLEIRLKLYIQEDKNKPDNVIVTAGDEKRIMSMSRFLLKMFTQLY